ncbi:MAG TPA: hypothetical protein PLW93_05350, partial [Candidatus Absconditabacterales bacterium]|nr:hypothetical protein [Candidatus Absconditabacterales bacterium]
HSSSDNLTILNNIFATIEQEHQGTLERFESYGNLVKEVDNQGNVTYTPIGLPNIASFISNGEVVPYYDSYEDMLRDAQYSYFMNVTSFAFLSDKNMKYRKHFADAVKRNKGLVGFGTRYEKHSETGKHIQASLIREVRELNKWAAKSDIADGQGLLSDLAFEEYILKQGGIKPKYIEPVLQKVRLGVPISIEEQTLLDSINASYAPKKTVAVDSKTYHKLSYAILTREHTSRVLPGKEAEAKSLRERIMSEEAIQYDDSLDKPTRLAARNRARKLYMQLELVLVARTGYEKLHNLRQHMFFFEIDAVMPESASKLARPIAAHEKNGHYNLYSSLHTMSNSDWMLQTEIPTGKREITYLSQLLHIIDNEQRDLNAHVDIFGKQMTVKEARDRYRYLVGARIRTAVNEALKELGELTEEGGYLAKPDFKMWHKKVMETLLESGSDESLLGFARDMITAQVDGSNLAQHMFKYNLSIPAIEGKFEQLFLAHFTKNVIKAIVPGQKFVIMSGFGQDKVADRLTDTV